MENIINTENWTNSDFVISKNHYTWYNQESTESLEKRARLIKLQESLFSVFKIKRNNKKQNLIKKLKDLGFSTHGDAAYEAFMNGNNTAIKILDEIQEFDWDFDYQDACYSIDEAHYERVNIENELNLRKLLDKGINYEEAVVQVRKNNWKQFLEQ